MTTQAPKDEATGREPVRLEELLRSGREAMGLSIRRLAERTGLHHASLARIELGEQRPTPETLQRLASVLELDEADLFALAGHRLPERLPSLPAYLRAKYRMPEEAAAQLNEYFGFLAEKYKIEIDGDADASPDPKRSPK
jgi:transcriptional regulator with XRE-family HTH domain